MPSLEMSIELIRLFYKQLLRDILVKVSISTEFEWDDKLVELCDKVFGYKG